MPAQETFDLEFPYGKDFLSFSVPRERFKGTLVSHLHHFKAEKSEDALVQDALAHPLGTPPLRDLAKGKRKVVLIASDHTRPVPSKVIVPPMLEEIRQGNPNADITILIATGCHRGTTAEELEDKFGPEIIKNEKIVIHDCDSADMVNLGKLPSGGDLILNRVAAEADLLAAEGTIEPHFFAGFSGGPKSVLPGIASRKTVVYNHNAEFISHPRARTGIIEGNPIHIDMRYGAKKIGLGYICNVVINASKTVIYAAAGDCDSVHRAGSEFLLSQCRVTPTLADIVITTNGGYPLDQNIYQAVKGMTAAEAAVRKGGVIIMLAKSNDGHGAPEFYKTFKEEKNLDNMLDTFLKTPKDKTRIDQWQSQIFARVLQYAKVIYISDATDEMVQDFHMIPAHSIKEAVKKAEAILGDPHASITAIPDGVSVILGS
jgi:nickel-dependent lactate racemase